MVNKIWFMFPFARDRLYFQEFTESTFHQSWLSIATGTIKEMQRNFFFFGGGGSVHQTLHKK